MRGRRIKRLYKDASDAYRDGALEAVSDGHLGRRRGDPTTYSERDAIELAYQAGHKAGTKVEDHLPTEIWSLVLAEAIRP